MNPTPEHAPINRAVQIYVLFAGWEVRIVKNCDRGLENAARGRRPGPAFSTIRTDPKSVNKYFLPSSQTKKSSRKKNSRKRYCDRGQR